MRDPDLVHAVAVIKITLLLHGVDHRPPEVIRLVKERLIVTLFTILDHECRDRHLWALALYGMRRGEIAGRA